MLAVILIGIAIVLGILWYLNTSKETPYVPKPSNGVETNTSICKSYTFIPKDDKPHYLVIEDCNGNTAGHNVTQEKKLCARKIIMKDSSIEVKEEGFC